MFFKGCVLGGPRSGSLVWQGSLAALEWCGTQKGNRVTQKEERGTQVTQQSAYSYEKGNHPFQEGSASKMLPPGLTWVAASLKN